MTLLQSYLDQTQTDEKSTSHLDEIAPGVLIGLSAANLVMAGVKLYKDYFTKAARACVDLIGNEKNMCVLKFKLDGLRRQMRFLRGKMGECSKARNPEKCQARLAKEMAKITSRIKLYNVRYKHLEKLAREAEEKARQEEAIRRANAREMERATAEVKAAEERPAT